MSEGQGRPDRKGSRLMGYMKGGFDKWPEWLPSRIARCAVVRPQPVRLCPQLKSADTGSEIKKDQFEVANPTCAVYQYFLIRC